MTDERPRGTIIQKMFGRLIEFVVSNFLRLNIANKILLGFSVVLLLLVVVSAYSLTNLNRLNSFNERIVLTDIPIILATEKMIDLVLSEELYLRRYLIFRTSDVLELYEDKKAEFNLQVERISHVPGHADYPLDSVVALHTEYTRNLIEGASSAKLPSSPISKINEEKIKSSQEALIAAVKQMNTIARLDQNEKTSMTADIGSMAFTAAAVLCSLGLILALTVAAIITRNISNAIKELMFATARIADGEFGYIPRITNKDELGDLAKSFVTMATRLEELEEMSLDTSPLTRLPGGTTIENVMQRHLKAADKIAFCLMDLDNFKAYNDHYGYARGNDMIQKTAVVIKRVVAEHGNPGDFVGHIGGDDFVVITSPKASDAICQAVCDAFDEMVPEFYDEADKEAGYIAGKNRQGAEVKFPLASISIAVVTNEQKDLNHIQFGEIAAEVKERAKSTKGSAYAVDKRKKQEEGY